MKAVIKNILIDLDGTLTDPKVGITASTRYGLNKIGHPIHEDLDIDWIIGPPLKASLAKLLQVDVNDDLAEQALLGYRERFATIGLFENLVYDGVLDTLQQLKARGYRLFVATAKPTLYAKQILEHFKLAVYFDEIYGSELSGERTNKAELIGYLLEIEQLDPEQTIMVGDREYDILGARQHDIATIAVEYGYGNAQELDRAQPLHRISDFPTLLQILTPST
ncbi:phosphoglycolate phosphatase [Acinetobacter calcoaceticus]|uniref:Phosphoglycolate phosphatase n=1 Tax=Acinetobacter calcoaceticus TaxID=471 RepID=A0A4R1XG29_ACICA|nr:phosphoglycolate phosphatase [Acinetobacter calcoaceticus]